MHAFAALVSANFAIAALAGRPSRAMNQFLALLLFLIAGNQGAEVCKR
jgi:hypothetical protein